MIAARSEANADVDVGRSASNAPPNGSMKSLAPSVGTALDERTPRPGAAWSETSKEFHLGPVLLATVRGPHSQPVSWEEAIVYSYQLVFGLRIGSHSGY